MIADLSVTKTIIFHLIVQFKQKDQVFKINKIFETREHTVLQFPPYNRSLNPVEVARAKLKNVVRRRKICIMKLLQLVKEGLKTITQDEWIAYYLHIEKLEKVCWVQDGVKKE
ncbi:uncharacterized protein LOC126412437 [Schistocerca serialis cubense]|uniref:uncharacterized protein LOC126412437 n=1 Tax=Schistocerca serialis cubense TaxID=2023355 RepID=UPI00214E49EF|nr:uncharacterized protein LOC126412437 [Schistocerca serialis cubense]